MQQSPPPSLPSTTVAPPPVAQRSRSLAWKLTYTAVAICMGTLGCGLALLAPADLLSWRGDEPDRESSRAAQSSSQQSGTHPFSTPADRVASSSSPTARRSTLAQGLIPYRLTRPVNIVLMGIDRVPDAVPGSPESFGSRSDTLLVARLDPITGKITLLSIPRDTQVEVPGYGLTKINHANWFGGPQLVRDVIAHNFNDLTLDRYIRIDTSAFRALVDLVGGLEVTVPEDMYYVDQTQGLYIDLKAGRQILDGDKAEQFARFRYDTYGDIGRVQRQQMLLKALQAKLIQPQIVTKLPQLLEVSQNYVDTNLTLEEMAALAQFGLQRDTAAIQMVMLPGRASSPAEFAASYWLMDEGARDRILADYFGQLAPVARNGFSPVVESRHRLPWDAEVATDMPRGSGYGDSGQDDRELARDSQESYGQGYGQSYEQDYEQNYDRSDFYGLQIAVQNASGVYGQGYGMAEYLRELGFWNVYVVEDWLTRETETQVIAQQGDLEAAAGVRGLLGLGEIEPSSTGAIDSDLTIRVGRDSLDLVAP
ncbi:MAG: LCP family protein [Prochlorothrix sp.]|nr:LCP family protein [Prochlorothrix sp.]